LAAFLAIPAAIIMAIIGLVSRRRIGWYVAAIVLVVAVVMIGGRC
jgi:hypothetical protein